MLRKQRVCGKKNIREAKFARQKARAALEVQLQAEDHVQPSDVTQQCQPHLEHTTDICISFPGTLFAMHACPLCLFTVVAVVTNCATRRRKTALQMRILLQSSCVG